MKPSSDSKNSGIKSPAMRKLARVRSAKSATASNVEAVEVAAALDGGVEGAEAGPADSLREAGSCFGLFGSKHNQIAAAMRGTQEGFDALNCHFPLY